MKRLTKASLEELAKVMPVLSEQEQCMYVAGDTYKMDQFGRITEIIKNGDPNVIQIGELSKESTGIFIPIPLGMEMKTYDYDYNSGEKGIGVMFENTGKSGTFEDEKRFFEDLVKNTNVEWGLASNKEEGGGVLFSSHYDNTVHCNPALRKGYDTLIHSHVTTDTDDNNNPLDEQQSGPDEGVKTSLTRKDKNGNRVYDYKDFEVYMKDTGKYYSY